MVVEDFPTRANATSAIVVSHLSMSCSMTLVFAGTTYAIGVCVERHIAGIDYPLPFLVGIVRSVTKIAKSHILPYFQEGIVVGTEEIQFAFRRVD